MNKVTGIIIGVLSAGFVGLVAWALIQKSSDITDYSTYNINSFIEADDHNGHIADHIKGDKNAEIVLVEYADFQCSGCASVSASVNKLVEKYKGKVAVIQRTYVLSYHQNGKAAAAAAEAAGLQGYWKEYGQLLFDNQNDWFYSDASERTKQFQEYFTKVSGGKGDLDKFTSDLENPDVTAKIKFDIGLANRMGEISYTPAFYLDGKFVDWANNANVDTPYKNTDKDTDFLTYMSKVIDEKLKNS